MIRQTITAHISPYFGGLAPETHEYVRHLNDEARRLKTGVSWIALENRILAHGNINRALRFTPTLGAWALRRAISAGYSAHRPQPFWETAAIEGEELVLRHGNSSHRKELRRLEKNRGRSIDEFKYARRWGLVRLSDSVPNPKLFSVLAETLYHKIDAIPRLERDRGEIYPSDFRAPQIPLWRPDRAQRAGLGLRDYSDGRRQKAASPGRSVLTPELAAFYLQWPMPDQEALKRIGRLYRTGCLWSEKGGRRLFDKCQSASAKKPSWWQYRANAVVKKQRIAADQMVANLERDFTRDEAEVA